MDDRILDGFKADFAKIKEKGFVKSNRQHDTGIGKTFEDLIGIVENNNYLADYKDILELKSSRKLTKSMVTLFTKSPDPKGVNSKLREQFGKINEESGLKILHTTLSATHFNTFERTFGFKLEVDEENEKIFIRIKELETNEEFELGAHYPFKILREKIENKLKYIAFITATHKKEGDQEFFKFEKVVLLSGLTFENSLKLLKTV